MPPDFRVPQPKNRVAAGGHVSVLADVQLHAPSLSCVGLWEHRRVAVPVVAIKLDNQPDVWHECVDTEFPADHVLPLIVNAERVEHRIGGDLKAVRLHPPLLRVHLKQHGRPRRIGIAAWDRAIGWVAPFPGRRPSKANLANLASIGVFTPALPFVGTCYGAKTSIGTANRSVERCCANFARPGGPGLTNDSATGPRARDLPRQTKRGLPRLLAYGACFFRQAATDAFACAAAIFCIFATRAVAAESISANDAILVAAPGCRALARPTAEPNGPCPGSSEDAIAVLANSFHGENIPENAATSKLLARMPWLRRKVTADVHRLAEEMPLFTELA